SGIDSTSRKDEDVATGQGTLPLEGHVAGHQAICCQLPHLLPNDGATWEDSRLVEATANTCKAMATYLDGFYDSPQG
ncbi:hypothetical protein, partial [Escherichia coli]|uniref:hypothetical protein n=1 Tax=Escherichia coli TaxID=562 RepID=UPI0024A98635